MQGVLTMQPAFNQLASENVFNVQLNYDPKSWDGNFHAISLHGSMEHLASDALNVKESLIRMKKYISSESINSAKANKVQDIMGMGKALWEFINAVYKSQWDTLFVENNTTFRSKFKAKFSPQTRKTTLPSNNKNTAKPTFVSHIPLPILAKSSKEVKEILRSGFFQLGQQEQYLKHCHEHFKDQRNIL